MGFLKNGAVFSLISVPGAGPLNGTVASGINDNGQVVGSSTTENTAVDLHGFERSEQTLTFFDVPGATDTQTSDINNLGQIVGRCFPAQGQIGRGFIKDGTKFTFFDAPGVQAPAGTFPYGINDSGQIVGDLIFETDSDNSLYESKTDNNTIALTITQPDLVPLAFQVPGTVTGPPYVPVTTVWGCTNQGTGPALNERYNALYLSPNPIFDVKTTDFIYLNSLSACRRQLTAPGFLEQSESWTSIYPT